MIAACAGLWFEAYTTEPTYAVADQMNIRSQVISRYGLNIFLNGLTVIQHADNIGKTSDFIEPLAHYPLPATHIEKPLPANELQTYTNDCVAGSISQPYWLEAAHPIGTYNISNDGNAGHPENPAAPKVEFEFSVEGHPIVIDRKLMYKYVDPAKGEIYQPVEITPPVTANIAGKNYIFNSAKLQNVEIKLKSFTKASGSISVKPIPGWKISPDKIDFTGKNKGDEWSVMFSVRQLIILLKQAFLKLW